MSTQPHRTVSPPTCHQLNQSQCQQTSSTKHPPISITDHISTATTCHHASATVNLTLLHVTVNYFYSIILYIHINSIHPVFVWPAFCTTSFFPEVTSNWIVWVILWAITKNLCLLQLLKCDDCSGCISCMLQLTYLDFWQPRAPMIDVVHSYWQNLNPNYFHCICMYCSLLSKHFSHAVTKAKNHRIPPLQSKLETKDNSLAALHLNPTTLVGKKVRS